MNVRKSLTIIATSHYLLNHQRAGDRCVEGITSSLRATSLPQNNCGDWDTSTVTSWFRPMGKERARGDEFEIQGGGYKGKEGSDILGDAEDDQECERKEIELNRYYVKMCSNRDAQRYNKPRHKQHASHVMFSIFHINCNLRSTVCMKFYNYYKSVTTTPVWG